MITKARKYLGWILLGLLLLFMLINWEPAKVNVFFLTKMEMPTWLLIFGSAAAGSAWVYMVRAYKKVKGDEKK